MRYKVIKNLEFSYILYIVYCCYGDYFVVMDIFFVVVIFDMVDLCEWYYRRVGFWCIYRYIFGKVFVFLIFFILMV